MKKICGFKGLNGKFYEKQSECERADLLFKIEEVNILLNNLHCDLRGIIKEATINEKYNYEIERILLNRVEEQVCRLIIFYSDDFLKIIKKKEELKEILKELQGEYNFKNSWWYKFFIQ